MRLLEPRPARVSFRCDCRECLSFSTFDKLGDRRRIECAACGRVWEQALVVDEGDRGWRRTLVSGPARPAPARRIAAP